MKPTDDTSATDGGASVFGGETTAEVSRKEQARQFFQEYFVASARIMWESWRTRVGGAIILFYVLLGTVGVYLTEPPEAGEGTRLLGVMETMQFPLGTDGIGMGIMGQIIHATPGMLLMILAGAVFTTVVATVVGTVAGYKGGVVDRVLMTIADTAVSIPGLPLVIVLAFLLRPQNPIFVGVVVTINAWAGLARSIRAQVLTLREESYVQASRIMGISSAAILFKDVLPNLMPYVLVNFTISARRVIFASVALYFLGVLPVSGFNWGYMLNLAFNSSALYSLKAIHWLVLPMVTIVVLTYGLILFGQAGDRIFNPQTRLKHLDEEEPEKP